MTTWAKVEGQGDALRIDGHQLDGAAHGALGRPGHRIGDRVRGKEEVAAGVLLHQLPVEIDREGVVADGESGFRLGGLGLGRCRSCQGEKSGEDHHGNQG